MFEKATRKKLRFSTNKGLLSVEDLWDLNLTALDGLARGYHKKIKEAEEVSFIAPAKVAANDDELSFEIVKHIIGVKLKEKAAAELSAAKKKERATLLALIEDKKQEALKDSSIEDLMKRVEALDQE